MLLIRVTTICSFDALSYGMIWLETIPVRPSSGISRHVGKRFLWVKSKNNVISIDFRQIFTEMLYKFGIFVLFRGKIISLILSLVCLTAKACLIYQS